MLTRAKSKAKDNSFKIRDATESEIKKIETVKAEQKLEEKAPSKQEYMKSLATELHKPFQKTYPRLPVQVPYKNHTWAMDLCDMGTVGPTENDGYKFMLT